MVLTAKGQGTRQRIIKGAAEFLVSDDGAQMTLDDVRAITGTSKGQLFHYFPGGKEELLLAIARYEADRVLTDQQPHLGSLTSWAAWERWREAVLSRYRAQGVHCPLGSLMSQVGNVPGAAEVTASLLSQWQGLLREGVEAMQSKGLIDAGLDADRAAAALVAGVQGGVVVLRSTGSTMHLEAVLDLLIERLHKTG